MRVLVVDSYYSAFVDQVYASHAGLADATYARQKEVLMGSLFGTSDFYSTNLEALGHAATEVVYTCDPLQRRWATEHGMNPGPQTQPFRGMGRLPWSLQFRERAKARILAAQVEEFRPDVVHFQDPVGTPRQVVAAVRAHTRVVTAQVASRVPDFAALSHFDLMLTSFPHYVDRFRKAGVRSEYFNLAFEPRVLTKLTKAPVHDVVFVGGLSARHVARTRWLESIASRVNLKWWGYGLDALTSDSPLRAAYQSEAWGIDMYNIFLNSRIVLNHHIDEAEDNANNMRLYEATGTGALLLTDSKKNLADLFAPEREVATYSNADHCVERIEYFLSNEGERAAIAKAGQERTLSSHTYRHRMEQFVNLLAR